MAGERVLVIDDSPTITKVVQLVLTKVGYQVDTASDGEAGLAAARATRPDVILLDFVMPRMNGYQFCRELVADAKLRDIPVVLMSAKGDQVGERSVQMMGIVDYITKPFSPDTITSVVQHTIAKLRPGSTAEGHAPAPPGDEPPTHDADRAELRRTSLAQLRSSIVQLLAVDAARHGGDAAPAIQQAEAALDDAALQRVLATVDLDVLGDAAAGLRGDLGVVPLAEILQVLVAQAQSGVLTVERGRARVEIYLGRGRVDQAIGRGLPDELRLGRFLVDAGVVNPADLAAGLDASLAASAPQPRLIGQQLVADQRLRAADLAACLTRQSRELIYATLRWPDGRFGFAAGVEPPPHVADAGLALDVEAILLEGYRRVDAWHLIERAIDNVEMVLSRNEDAIARIADDRLARDELAVLGLVDGARTVEEIIRASGMGSFEVSKLLYRLVSLKLIRRAAPAPA